MDSSRQFGRFRRGAAILAIAAWAAGCSVNKQELPSPIGPSGFAQSLIATAAPQILARDGSSMSTISVIARNPDGTPMVGRRLLFSASAGTLAVSERNTGTDGLATVTYVAPGLNEPVNTVTIFIIPIEASEIANTHSTSVRIQVLGPSVPVAAFTVNPAAPAVLDAVTFDATTSRLDGSECGSACSYSWSFDDGDTGQNLVVQHQFRNSGVFNVSLTATVLATGASNTVTKPIVVSPPAPPVANFRFGPCVPVAVACQRFTDLSTVGAGAAINSQTWDFADGTSPANGNPVQHVFTAPALTYEVTLTVTDTLGRSATVTKAVAVP